ncbi:MAG: hypothetical protein AAFR64_00130 [Pseudomonadota bacterium]
MKLLGQFDDPATERAYVPSERTARILATCVPVAAPEPLATY